MKYLLDTNVLIECLRGNPDMIAAVKKNGRSHDLAMSSITYGELMVGIMKHDTPRRRGALQKVLSPMKLIDFDRDAAVEFARIKSHLEQSGKSIGPYDMQIAGHAISTSRCLITHNVKEFSRIRGLQWEDWQV